MKNKKRKPVVPIMFDENMTKALKFFAKKDGRTFAGLVRYVLAEWLERRGAGCLMLMFAVSVIILMGCSNPTAPKTTAIAWKEVKIYYNPQTADSLRVLFVMGDTLINIIQGTVSPDHVHEYFVWDTLRGTTDFPPLALYLKPYGDTARVLIKSPNDTLRSYYYSNYYGIDAVTAGSADTLIVTKDTTWILN